MFDRRTAVIFHDFTMVIVAWAGAVLMRYAFEADVTLLQIAQEQSSSLPLIIIPQIIILHYFGLYRGLWRFASIPDLWNIIRAAGIGVCAIMLTLVLFNRLEGVPRAAFIFYPFLLVFLLGVPRLLYRLWRDHSLQFLLERKPDQRVLIIGAGRSGELLARDMLRGSEYLPVAFLDDQSRLHGAKLHGVPIIGSSASLIETVKKLEVDLVIIAVPSADKKQMQRIVNLCENCGVPFRTLPGMQDITNGTPPGLKAVRNVSIDDLLGREKIQLDRAQIESRLSGKTVMISGGGGSIGSELCRQIASLKPSALVLFERCEFNLYQIDWHLRQEFPDLVLHSCLGDICDKNAVNHVLGSYRPQVIFHAAAYKHVPLLEYQVREAVRNNVLGTRCLAQAATRHDCQAFVMISTDKAVNPGNVMGAGKRAAELLCQSMNSCSKTRFITVRFGNVLASAGSVVPLFKSQIAAGGPVTVTHPEVTRYFMTIPEACQLILQAGAMGKGGEIFVLDMGKPIKISYLAEQLIRLSGKKPGRDIKIVFSGLRPGEKLHEKLFHADEEHLDKTRHDKILLASQRSCEAENLDNALDELEALCAVYDEAGLKMQLKKLVPEFDETEAGEKK